MQPQHVGAHRPSESSPVRQPKRPAFTRPRGARRRASTSWAIEQIALPIVLGVSALAVIAIGGLIYAF